MCFPTYRNSSNYSVPLIIRTPNLFSKIISHSSLLIRTPKFSISKRIFGEKVTVNESKITLFSPLIYTRVLVVDSDYRYGIVLYSINMFILVIVQIHYHDN